MKKVKISQNRENLNIGNLEMISSVHSTLIAKLYNSWISREGSLSDFRLFLSQGGYSLPERTLMNWVHSECEHGVALLGGEKRGKKEMFSSEEKELICGYVYDHQMLNQKTSLNHVNTFCRIDLLKKPSEATLSRIMAELGFSSRKMQAKTNGYQVNIDYAIEMAYDWLNTVHKEFDKNKLWSIDCFFTGHRTDTHKSFTVSGGNPANFSAAISTYTALGISCVCANGKHFPCILFTTNPIFNRECNTTERRKKIWDNVDTAFSAWKVDVSRVIFVPQEKLRSGNGNSANKSIVPAHLDRVRDFFSRYNVEKDSIILSDAGREFINLEQFGFKKHIKYPGPVHQWLSPNDNRLHGSAKQCWKNANIDYRNEAESLAALIHFMDKESVNSPAWFQTNLLVNDENICREKIAQNIGGKNFFKNKFYSECRDKFRFKFELDPRVVLNETVPDELNGIYWVNK